MACAWGPTAARSNLGSSRCGRASIRESRIFAALARCLDGISQMESDYLYERIDISDCCGMQLLENLRQDTHGFPFHLFSGNCLNNGYILLLFKIK